MTEILVAAPEYLHPDAKAILEGAGNVTARRLSRAELERAIGKFDAVIVRVDTQLDAALLSKAHRLRLIGSVTTGVNHIDSGYAASMGIRVISLSGAHTVPTAEYSMALILSLCRRIPWAYESIKQGRWERHRFIGTELSGKTLGIVGIGKIGARLSEYAKAFGMEVIAFDPYAGPAAGIEMVKTIDGLLERSDIVSIHCMLTDETRGMIDGRRLSLLRRGAYLVNAARAEIVDTRALLEALGSGTLAGAALDVFETEPLEDASGPLVRYALEHDNLLLTPHLGASTEEAVRAGSVEIARKVAGELMKMPQGRRGDNIKG